MRAEYDSGHGGSTSRTEEVAVIKQIEALIVIHDTKQVDLVGEVEDMPEDIKGREDELKPATLIFHIAFFPCFVVPNEIAD